MQARDWHATKQIQNVRSRATHGVPDICGVGPPTGAGFLNTQASGIREHDTSARGPQTNMFVCICVCIRVCIRGCFRGCIRERISVGAKS